MISTVDPDSSTHPQDRASEYRDGYKAHVVVEPDHRADLRGNDLTAGNVPDGPTGVELHAERGTAARQVLADSAYGSGETRAALREAPASTWRSKRSRGRPHGPRRLRTATTSSSTTTARTVDLPSRTHRHRSTPASNADVRTPLPRLPAPHALHHRPNDGRILQVSTTTTSNSSKPRRAWRDGDFADDYRQVPTDGRTQPSPGSSDPVIAASATAASTATASGSPTEPPPSTSDASSTSASPTDPPAGP